MFQCKTKNVMLIIKKKKKKNIMNELYEMDLSLKIPNEKEMLTVWHLRICVYLLNAWMNG